MEEEFSPYLDFNEYIRIKEGHMVLWDQPGKIQHITFHLNDSLPAKERENLRKLKEMFETLNPKPWDTETQKRYYKLITERQERLLDAGYGSCVFKSPAIRKIFEDSLKYNSDKYYLISFVIMPNHVHMLLIMEDGYEIDEVFGNIKRFTSRTINSKLGMKGELWNKEIYARIMRSKEHFGVTRSYIRKNPRYLRRDEFTYWEAKLNFPFPE